MAFPKTPQDGLTRFFGILGLSLLLVALGSISCQKAEQPAEAEGQEAVAGEAATVFEGTVKVALGHYMFIPEARGFDIVVQGDVEGEGPESLVGKVVRVEGELSPEKPALLVADSIEVKEDGTWRNVFTRTQEVVLEDYLGTAERREFPILEDLAYDKKDVWEGVEKAKIYGKLEQTENGEVILVLDEEGKQVGKVLVDGISEFARYYLNKLRLFDKFWFYVAVKDTVEWRTRRRTREMFHADVLFAGLF